jgi:hypothetical protein
MTDRRAQTEYDLRAQGVEGGVVHLAKRSAYGGVSVYCTGRHLANAVPVDSAVTCKPCLGRMARDEGAAPSGLWEALASQADEHDFSGGLRSRGHGK